MSMLLDMMRAAGGIVFLATVWFFVQHLARRLDNLPPDQDMLDRACNHCGHQATGCGLGKGECPHEGSPG
jgi:hypothetical protein